MNALQVQCLFGWAGIGSGLIVAPLLYRVTNRKAWRATHKRR